MVTQECRGDLPPLRYWQRARFRRQRLNTNVIGARGLMSADALDNSRQISPCDDGVDQFIAAAAGKVLVTEAETAQVVHVVRPCDLSRFGTLGFKHDGLLDCEEFITA
jgi:hypothetical protein